MAENSNQNYEKDILFRRDNTVAAFIVENQLGVGDYSAVEVKILQVKKEMVGGQEKVTKLMELPCFLDQDEVRSLAANMANPAVFERVYGQYGKTYSKGKAGGNKHALKRSENGTFVPVIPEGKDEQRRLTVALVKDQKGKEVYKVTIAALAGDPSGKGIVDVERGTQPTASLFFNLSLEDGTAFAAAVLEASQAVANKVFDIKDRQDFKRRQAAKADVA